MNRYDMLKQTIDICKREGVQWKKCPVWKNVDMDRIKHDKVYRDEVASDIMFWTGRNDLFPYKGCSTPKHLAAHDGEWDSMQEEKLNEIGDTENGMYAIGQVAGRAYDRMLNSPRNKKVDGVVALDPKYGKVAQDAAYAAAGGYIQWQKNFEKVNGRKPSDKERQAYMQNYHNGGLDYGKPESERKGVIKLSESQLRGMIAECMKKVLSEKYSYQKYGKKSNGLDSDSVHSTIKMMTPQCQNPRKGFDSDSVHKVIKGMMGEGTSWDNDPSHDTESRIPSSYIGSSAGDIEQIKHNLENITNHIYSICKGLSNEDYSFGYMDANSKTTDVLRKMWPLVHELGDIWGYRFY